MQTRHRKQSRDTAHEKDPTLKKRGPGRPPLIKKHTETSKQSDNKNDTRNKKNMTMNKNKPTKMSLLIFSQLSIFNFLHYVLQKQSILKINQKMEFF